MRKDQGMVLITTMIFLFVLSLLVIAEIENNRYEYQMMNHYQNRAIAFADAENILKQNLEKIVKQNYSKLPVKSIIRESILIQKKQKEVDYIITILANYQAAFVQLQACYQTTRLSNTVLHAKLKYWLELNIS